MGVRIDVTRTKFYDELSKEQQKEFFNVREKKFLPAVDNIYYNLFLYDDYNDNPNLYNFLSELEYLKSLAMTSNKLQYFDYGLSVDVISAGMYRFCLTNPDLYDIFITSHLPNNNTPRIHVQLRAYGLWLHGAEKLMKDSYNHVLQIFKNTGCSVMECMENRIDFCYHTNAIHSPEKFFSEKNMKYYSDTNLEKWMQMGNIEKKSDCIIYHKDYMSLGSRKSNTVFVRIYNKALEVVENGYKGFFFQMWYENGLINFYDKYCFEKALIEQNYDHVHKAKLEFYIEYGANPDLKKKFSEAINYKYATLESLKELASDYMPELTTVMNIEYQTKRKFYSYSDDFIDYALKLADNHKDVPGHIKRIFKILDNRRIFLDYLTGKTLSFKKSDGSFASWWKRLRDTKLEGIKTDEKLIRDYAVQIDEKIVRKKFINTVVTNAVYAGGVDTDFVDDLSGIMSNINDNHINELRIAVYKGADGTEVNEFYGSMLSDYKHKKIVKYEKIKNRKKIADAKQPPTKFNN